MSCVLSVNVNKVCTLRNARGGSQPNLIRFTEMILDAGVRSITAHPRSDRRHITPQDIEDLYKYVAEKNRGITDSSQHIETNWEGDLREEFLQLTEAYPPSQCTLVPVSYGELTSHRGYKVKPNGYLLQAVISHFQALGVRMSVFVEADDEESVYALAEMGCDRIEIYTEPYAQAFERGEAQSVCHRIRRCAQLAVSLGMGVNAGHDLDRLNIPFLLQAVPSIDEISVGHHLMAYALEVGITSAITTYLNVCHTGEESCT